MDAKKRADEFNKRVQAFRLKMKRLQIDGSLMMAKRTLELMRELLAMHRHEDHIAVIKHVTEVGSQLIIAKPQELTVGNMVRRVLHLVREVAAQEGHPAFAIDYDAPQEDVVRAQMARPISLLTLLDPPSHPIPEELVVDLDDPSASSGGPVGPEPDSPTESMTLDLSGSMRKKKAKRWGGKAKVLELLNELIEEMDLAEDAIVDKATEHIHANEVILTFGLSQTTLKFLKNAAERRQFQVVVAEGAPKLLGLTMAQELLEAGIPTLVIPDSAIFAMMARVNKVLVGAQAVLATGGIVSQSGSRLVALAAKHHRVPFVVVTGLYKLSPLFPHDPHVMFSNFNSPSTFTDRRLTSSALRVGEDGQYVQERLQLPCPAVDYIEPENIDLLITDTGGYTPSYIYRLLSEYYSREDYVLSKDLLNKMTGH